MSGRVGGRKTIRSSKENGINHANSTWKYISIKLINYGVFSNKQLLKIAFLQTCSFTNVDRRLSGRVGGRKTIRSSKECGINHANSFWKYINCDSK